ncbi:VENN motif pre-toxin domain-containing protein [Mangrovibacter sp. SLW1]
MVGLSGSGHADGITHSAVAEDTLTVRDTDAQNQDISGLSRDTENANGSIDPIFNKEKEQKRLQMAQMISEIGTQASDIARTQGEIAGAQAEKDPQALAKARAELEAESASSGKVFNGDNSAIAERAHADAMKDWGTGSAVQRGIQAATGALTALSGGNLAGALASASALELAELIGHHMGMDDSKEAKAVAHAILGGVVAKLNGGNALAGAAGGAAGDLVASTLYPDLKPEQLSEEQKQKISAISTIIAGIAGNLASGDSAGTIAGAQAGKNAVENNYLSVSDKTELEIAKQTLKNSKDPAEREKAQQKYDALLEKDISSDEAVIAACSNGKAASAACAGERLKVFAAKGGYETGNYNNQFSDMYPDAYGQIVNLLNITSVDAQNQQQVKDAMINYFMVTKGVDRQTAESYTETKQGLDIIAASVTPILGSAAAKQLSKIVDANLKVIARKCGWSEVF